MNPINAIFVASSAESASDGLIVGEIFPVPRIDPSYGYIVHCSLASSTDSLRDNAGEGLEGHVNDPRRRFHISTSYRCRRFRVDYCSRWGLHLDWFEAACVCWNRRIRHTSHHVVDGWESDAVHGVQGSLNLLCSAREIKPYGFPTNSDFDFYR